MINKNTSNNVMFMLLSIIILGSFLLSCSEFNLESTLSNEVIQFNSDDLLIMEEYKIAEIATKHSFSSDQSNYIAIRFLELQDSKYNLILTQEDAIKLGISQKEFERMQNEVIEVNALIKQWIDNEIDFKLTDPISMIKNNDPISHDLVRLRSGSESNGGGTKSFLINNKHYTTSSFFAPSATKDVSITCFGGGLVTGYNAYTSSCGNMENSGGVGLLGVWSTTIKLTCSNTNVTVGAKTSNSNGGTCTYHWQD